MDKKNYSKNDYDALMKSNIPAALSGVEGMRFDSAEDASVFFARELDYIKAQSYDVEYPELTALSLFPISNEVNPGAETVTYYSYDKTGMAKIIHNYSTDLPRADVKGKPSTAFVRSIGASYGYSVQEMRASRMAGKSLDVRKAEAARYSVDYTLNKIAWAGDEDNGLIGILSPNNDIPLFTPAANASGKTEWKDKTADEILEDITAMQTQVSRSTKNVERPDTLIVPDDVHIMLCNKRIENTGISVKKYLLDNAPYLKNIIGASELSKETTDINPYASQSKNVALFCSINPKKFTIEHPLPFYQYPLQAENLEIKVPCEARTAGAIIYYPLSALIAVGI